MKNRLLPLILVTLSLLLSGCGDSEPKYHGIGFTLVSEYPEEFYFKVWSNEYPESGEPGLARHFGVYNDSRHHYSNSVFHCADGDRDYRENGNHLDAVYLKVTTYEYKETSTGPATGRELDSKRWDGLECFKPYTVVLDEQGNLQLYKCRACLTPEDREGLKPWTPSEA